MKKLLQQIAGHGPTTKTVSRILAAFEGKESTRGPAYLNIQPKNAYPPDDADDYLDESLTPREREILTLMAEPIGLKVIAARMDISYATARRYTISIYGKFGVHSRWEAVDSAVRKGIISPH
jgi:DNA-binding NarL/FixJ family response regulator